MAKTHEGTTTTECLVRGVAVILLSLGAMGVAGCDSIRSGAGRTQDSGTEAEADDFVPNARLETGSAIMQLLGADGRPQVGADAEVMITVTPGTEFDLCGNGDNTFQGTTSKYQDDQYRITPQEGGQIVSTTPDYVIPRC